MNQLSQVRSRTKKDRSKLDDCTEFNSSGSKTRFSQPKHKLFGQFSLELFFVKRLVVSLATLFFSCSIFVLLTLLFNECFSDFLEVITNSVSTAIALIVSASASITTALMIFVYQSLNKRGFFEFTYSDSCF